MQRESSTAVSVVSRADVKLATDGHALAACRALVFDEDVIVCAHDV